MKNNKIIQSIGFKITIILICIAVTALTLNQYAKLIQHLLTIKYDWQFELFMVIGMLFFQYPFKYADLDEALKNILNGQMQKAIQ